MLEFVVLRYPQSYQLLSLCVHAYPCQLRNQACRTENGMYDVSSLDRQSIWANSDDEPHPWSTSPSLLKSLRKEPKQRSLLAMSLSVGRAGDWICRVKPQWTISRTHGDTVKCNVQPHSRCRLHYGCTAHVHSSNLRRSNAMQPRLTWYVL